MPYSIKTGLWKVAKIFVEGGVGAVIAWLTGLPQTETIVITIAVLTFFLNWIKNRNIK